MDIKDSDHHITEDMAGALQNHPRLTCTCGETLVHQPYMMHELWKWKKKEFLKEHKQVVIK